MIIYIVLIVSLPKTYFIKYIVYHTTNQIEISEFTILIKALKRVLGIKTTPEKYRKRNSYKKPNLIVYYSVSSVSSTRIFISRTNGILHLIEETDVKLLIVKAVAYTYINSIIN